MLKVSAALGNTNFVKRTICRARAKHLQRNPKILQKLDIDGVWIMTGDAKNEQFLIHDSGSQSPNRMVVFASDVVMRHLAASDTWIMDGTFDTVPHLFTQLI